MILFARIVIAVACFFLFDIKNRIFDVGYDLFEEAFGFTDKIFRFYLFIGIYNALIVALWSYCN